MSEKLRGRIEEIVNRATIHNEAGVKRVVRRVLDKARAFSFMPPANSYGKSGISDIIALKYGKVVFIETKYGYNKPTTNQLVFGEQVSNQGGAVFVVINERNLVDALYYVVLYWETGIYEGDTGV